jgi:hypothetical protein
MSRENQRRLRQFHRQLKARIIDPYLSALGFVSVDKRVFHRHIDHEDTTTIQVVSFQLGERWLAGKFTVNLGVYNHDLRPCPWLDKVDFVDSGECGLELSKRLGFFVEPKRGLVAKLLNRPVESDDHWWPLSPKETVMKKTLDGVRVLLETHGLPWLNYHTCREAFAWEAEQTKRRRQAVDGQNCVEFEPEMFVRSTDTT